LVYYGSKKEKISETYDFRKNPQSIVKGSADHQEHGLGYRSLGILKVSDITEGIILFG
jgi:hypothetical protein